jgi:transcription antitermination factor NusG
MFEQAVRKKEDKIHWYGIRVFYNRISPFKEALDEYSIRYFIPMHTVEKQIRGQEVSVHEPLVGSLVFVQTTEERLKALQMKFAGRIASYTNPDDGKPAVIPDKQMDQFMWLCELRDVGLEYLGDDAPEYHQGDRVRVIHGVFKGLEGHIKRIRRDRRLIVTVEGVAAFATGFIPPAHLEIIS